MTSESEDWDEALAELRSPAAERLFSDDQYLGRVLDLQEMVLGQWRSADADSLRVIVATAYTDALAAAGVDPADPMVGRVVALTIDLALMHVLSLFEFDFEKMSAEMERVVDHLAVLGGQAIRLAGGERLEADDGDG